MNVALIAKVAHEINKAYCESLGDLSQPSWEDAPDWQISSAMNGVQMHLANPDAGPDESHKCWMKEKLDDGWIYGPVKDPDKKEHHCLVPFEELPQEQKAKNYLFRAVVHNISEHILVTEKAIARYIGSNENGFQEMIDAVNNKNGE